MNEEAIKDAYGLFTNTGYNGSYEDFKQLIQSNPEARADAYGLFTNTGYNGSQQDFDELMGVGVPVPVKKKEESAIPLWLQKQEAPKPKPEPALPFLESKPSGISLGSQRVPEAPPMFEAPPMRTPEQVKAIVEAPEKAAETADSEQGWLLNTVSALDRGFYKNLVGNPIKGMGTLLEGATGKVFGGSGKGPISDALISFGDYFNKAIDELAPQDEAYKNSLSDQFGQAFGQVASLVLTGGVSGAGKEGVALAATPQGAVGVVKEAGKKLATDLASPTAISAGLSMGQSEFDRAKELGATDDQAFEVFYKNAAVGSILEQIPVMQFLKRFNQSTAGGVANYIKTKGVAGLTGGFEEMTTEVLQQLYANKSAQDIYNINQSILEGVGESGGVGFGVGFLLNAMGARAKVLRKEGKPEEAQLIENQIAEFENKPTTPPASYSINGIKVDSPKVIDDMIETMDVENLTKANIEITNDPVLSNKLQDKMITSSIKEEVREANPNLDEQTLDQITALEKERRKFEGKKTQTAKDKLSSINSQIKTLQENAVQKPSTEEGVLRPEEPKVGLQEVGKGNAKEQAPTQETIQETESKIKRRDLFDGVGAFSRELGGSTEDAVPVSHSENNGIEFVQYANPKTGSIDVIVTGTSENDFVGFYRIYENGKPTNKWSSKFENQSRNKENFKSMIGGVQAMLPEGHEYTEKTSISTDGLRVWNQQLDRGYELQYDNDGNLITNEVAINGDAIVNELGIDVSPGDFRNISVTNNEQFNKVKQALIPYLNKMGLTEKNIKWENGTVKIDLPVLKKSSKEEVVTPEEDLTAALERIDIPEDTETLPGIDDELKTINESLGRVKEEVDSAKDERELQDLSEKVSRAKKKIATADDTDAAIEEFKQAEKEKSDFEEAISKKKNFNKVDALIADEVYQKNRGGYEYQELFDQDPRLAAIQSAKDTIELGKGDFLDEEGVARYENDIKVLEEDIAKFPVKQAEPAPKVSSKTPKAKAPKAKGVPIPVAIPKPAPTPAPTPTPTPAPSAVVSQPTTKAVGPEALRQEYINKINDVRLNQDRSRTPKQIDERVKELQAEYNKLKAEMTAPKPKAAPAPKVEAPAPKVEAKTTKKQQEIEREIKRLESDIDVTERKIEDFEEQIEIEKGNYEEAKQEIRRRRDELKGKKMSKAEREEANEEIIADAKQAKDDYEDLVQQYKDDIAAEKADLKRYQKELAKLKATPAPKAEPTPVSVVEEEEPSYDEIKDLDPTDETVLKKILNKLDSMDDGLSEFGRGNLSSGMAIPLAKAIIKSLKVLVKTGITLQEAIKRVAAENNLEAKAIVDMIKEVDKAQSPMAKLKAQIQTEVQAAKEGARDVSDAIKAITDYFNFNANRGNLTRRDLGRVINAIAKVKDQKSLNKAADKIFAIIDKAKTDIIEVSDYKMMTNQIKLEAKAALKSKKDINQKRKDLSNVIKAMETTGKLSAAKAKAILNKIGKVNLDNPASVDAFLDYVENVFEDAAYEVELAGINAKLARAKQNINKKIGTAKTLTTVLNRLFSIKPSLIPVEILDDYKDIIDMFGDSAAVITPEEITEVTQQAQEILDQIDDQLSAVPALATKLFNYGNAVLTEDGELDYAATIKNMKDDKVIDDAEYNLMKKYKSYILPRAVKVPKTKEELAEEKKVLVKQAKEAANEATISPLASDDEKKMASSIIKLSKTKAVEGLDNRQLENLLKIFDNFKNGYFPAYANGINNDLIAAENAGFLSKAITKAKMPTLLSVKAKLRNRREALFAKVKSAPLFNIDEIFGDFKTKDIFNSIFNALAQNQQRYALEIEKINQRLEDALNKIAKSYGNNENKIVESKMRMAIYRIQREFQSNPGDPRVNPAIEYINKTVEAIREGNTNYSEEDADMLEKIAKDYSDGKGGIDSDKLKESFNTAENEALDLFDELNKSLEDKATFTGDVVRGDKVRLLNNYNHISVLPTKNENPDTIADAISKFDPKNVVSTKAKSLIERTTGAKPINFDVFSTVQRGANFVLMDYYLTNPVRIARKTINATRNMMEENGTFTEDAKTILNVVSDAVELALKASLDQSVIKDTFADKVIKEIARTGYRAMLGGIPRATTELTSNMAYIAMVAPQEWSNGVKTMKGMNGAKAVNIMEAVGSKVITRVYGSDPLKGRLVDPGVLSKRVGIGTSKLKGETKNVIATIHNNTTKKVKNSAEFVADTLISTPDKIMMRPLWFGSFEKAFQDFSGKKPDYDKIASNDADYMIQNKEALEAAGRVADEKVTMAGNVENPYMNALRTHISSDMSALTKTFKMFDNFMLKFQIGEFLVARRGLQAMMGNGNISKEQGAKLMAAVITRMTIYTIMSKMAAEFFYGLFLDDEEEDDDKSFAQKLGQGLASTFTSLLLGRDFGNAARSIVNYGVEKVNENYLDFLRDGEYDPYEDAIQYSFIPPEKKGKSLEAFDVLSNISGPYSPALKSLNLVTKKLTAEPKKEGAAIERQEAEKAIRVPLEILGNLGYVPLYKDIRAIVNKSIYSELDKEMDKQGQKQEETKPMGLNKTDLKRYYPEVYEQYYGEGTEEAAKRKLQKEKDILERRMKDDYYNYVPKQRMKGGFGGKKFGESSKKSSGFGSGGFGSGK